MQVSYNLKYRKANFHNKILLQKEGEIILQEDGFRLKGKGATDQGEFINFSDIKELYLRTTSLAFTTFAKEKYTLCDAGSLFEDFVIDFFKIRNSFLSRALFMRQGEFIADYDGYFERVNRFGKLIGKGRTSIKLHEDSLVIVPQKLNAFPVHFHFVSSHEFDELDYNLKLVCDDGSTVHISQLGDMYENFEEDFNKALGAMYERIVHDLKDLLYSGNTEALLKIINLMKGGRAVQLKKAHKIDGEIYQKILDTGFLNEAANGRFDFLKNTAGANFEENLYVGIGKPDKNQERFVPWVMWADPMKNIVAFTFMPSLNGDTPDLNVPKADMYFFKIIMERGNPGDKVKDKVLEVEQALLLLHFNTKPLYEDRREIRKTEFKYAIRKLPFLRILRKSFIGKLEARKIESWGKDLEKILAAAKI
ncbi:MAG: hypothetical protein ABH856_03025 [Patescibacteria group bacterium]